MRSTRMLVAIATAVAMLCAAGPAHAGFSITNNITGGGPGGGPRAVAPATSMPTSSWDEPMEVP